MFKIHTKDGKTTSLGLENPKKLKEWQKKLRSREFQTTITGITIMKECGGKFKCSKCKRSNKTVCQHCGSPTNEQNCKNGIQFSLSRPEGFNTFFYVIENIEPNVESKMKGGQRIICFVDDLKLVLMVHSGQTASRVSLAKIGKQRYNPYVD